jgi:endonuclease/exonuclease/phosphatase family metal-dependent hydrolase
MKSSISRLLAPLSSGAVFLTAILFAVSCEKKETPSAASVLPTAAAVEQSLTPQVVADQTIATTPVAAAAPTPSVPATPGKGLRFLAYNVENWLIMEERFDYDTRISTKNAPKPDKEKSAVISLVTRAQPDVFGVCEIGTKEDLLDIQTRLKSAGLDLPHIHFTGGMDRTRHLGLLSRYPIVDTATPADTQYKLNGKEYSIQRGVLDASIKTPDGRSWRFLGVHFKSKREVEDGDQNQMRINEAQLLRQHIDTILKADPQARLISYGDFNDTRGTATIRAVQGPFNSPRAMTPIPLVDSRQLYWTHFWAKEDIYSRIDFIFHSQSVKDDVIKEESKILDPENWNDASDHRALLGVFR